MHARNEKKKTKSCGSNIPHPSPHNFSYAPSLTRLATQIQFRDPSPSDFWRSYASLSIHGRNNLRFEFDWTFLGFGSKRNLILIDRSSKTWLQRLLSLRSTAFRKMKYSGQYYLSSTSSYRCTLCFSETEITPLFSYFNLIFRRFPLFPRKSRNNGIGPRYPPPPRLPSRVSLGRGVPLGLLTAWPCF